MRAKPPIRRRTESRTSTRAREARLQARTAISQTRFLAAFARTGNISASCRGAGVGRRTIYDWARTDEGFAEKYSDAKEVAIDALELEARRRAMLGTLRPIYQNGKRVGAVREFSDQLMITLLKAARPNKYRDNVHHKVGGQLGLAQVHVKSLSNDDLKRFILATAAGGAMAAALTNGPLEVTK